MMTTRENNKFWVFILITNLELKLFMISADYKIFEMRLKVPVGIQCLIIKSK